MSSTYGNFSARGPECKVVDAPFDEWGTPGSFACALCQRESNGSGGYAKVPGVALGMVVCIRCARRLKSSPKARRELREILPQIAWRSLIQRVADLLGITFDALAAEIERHRGLDKPDEILTTVEMALGFPRGTIDRALAYVTRREAE